MYLERTIHLDEGRSAFFVHDRLIRLRLPLLLSLSLSLSLIEKSKPVTHHVSYDSRFIIT
jgi:hypothetical protein